VPSDLRGDSSCIGNVNARINLDVNESIKDPVNMDKPRLLRPVAPPLGLYLRPGHNDHVAIERALVAGQMDLSGVVLNPGYLERQQDLLAALRESGVAAILDPCTVEMATPGGAERSSLRGLPWSSTAMPSPHVWSGDEGERVASAIAAFIQTHGFSAVLAPTHLILGASDPWFSVDLMSVTRLRRALDDAGATAVPIYYPLVVPGRMFRNETERVRLMAGLQTAPIDALWLRVDQFGTTLSGPVALAGYVRGCRQFHALGIPVIGERTGTLGLALMAFGAVGGIEHGVTIGESFDAGPLIRPPKKKSEGFSPESRVYLSSVGAFISKKHALALFEQRGMKALYGCTDTECCRRGSDDMMRDPRHHFLLQRSGEVKTLSAVPSGIREQVYLERTLRPASDRIIKLAELIPELESIRKRLVTWRTTFGALHEKEPARTSSVVPDGKRVPHRKLG
jgi:hypothetical protein